jgi:ankyrin repeat protein
MKLKKQKRSRKHVKKTYKKQKTYRKRGGGTGAGTRIGAGAGAGGEDPIFDAIRRHSVPEVTAMLNANPGVVNVFNNSPSQQFNSSGPNVLVDMTPLYFAVSRNMVHKKVSEQYNVINNNTAPDDYYQIAVLLLDRGANPNAATTQWFPGWSPIHWAAEYSQLDMVNLLKSRGANINATYQISSNPADRRNLRGSAEWRLRAGDFRDDPALQDIDLVLNYIVR